MRQIWDDVVFVEGVAPDQIVEHACLGSQIEEGPGLMDIEMRRTVGDAHAEHAA
jgi:hypothetical protein